MSQPASKLSRRTLFAGAGSAGALAAAARLMPVSPAAPAEPEPPRPAPARGGGYRLTEHVLRYYRTTRV
ncbi:formate dehydrogenase [Ramlibacter sp. 2FC]|uniref:formate dehydrogenase n=1 Tax=Ramlibacter sp. 2FC TaxID=2502188 RepID=UPI0010F50437|nr:formate dehydrogenase [Ramlibacter sp. 2FC]